MKILFLDTNVYLHYKDFRQIDWPEITRSEIVRIIIPPVTIRELNKHKDTFSGDILRDRAKNIIKIFSAIFNGPNSKSNPCVEIRFEDRDPIVNYESDFLNKEIQDDNLIATILMYKREFPHEKIALVTSDDGLTLIMKASRHEIETIKLPDNFRLSEKADEKQKKINKLEAEIGKLKNVTPSLSLLFKGGKKYRKYRIASSKSLEISNLEQVLSELKSRYPKLKENPQKGGVPSFLFLEEISDEDIDNYNRELEKYYNDYVEYLRDEISYKNFVSRSFELKFELVNEGNTPADDIDIFLTFPDGLTIYRSREFPSSPEPPSPPLLPKTRMEKLSNPMAGLIDRSDWMVPDGPSGLTKNNVTCPVVRHSGAYHVLFHVNRLKHNLLEAITGISITFRSFEEARSFHFEYEIIAANLAEKVSGILHIIINKK